MRPLHLVRLVLDRRALARAAIHRRNEREFDDGYVLHAGLAALFATSSEKAIVPLNTFAVDDTLESAKGDAASIFLLAYSELDEGALLERMGPPRADLVRQCSSRHVPGLEAGTRARFRTRICPVVRTKAPGDHAATFDRTGRKKSREVDAWLAHRFPVWSSEAPGYDDMPFVRAGLEWSERERVYTAWLGRELARDGACVLAAGARMESFERQPMHRRGASGAAPRQTLQRPNVIMTGDLCVGDADAFRALLARGIGRHRAFGFGMLLLRPATG